MHFASVIFILNDFFFFWKFVKKTHTKLISWSKWTKINPIFRINCDSQFVNKLSLYSDFTFRLWLVFQWLKKVYLLISACSHKPLNPVCFPESDILFFVVVVMNRWHLWSWNSPNALGCNIECAHRKGKHTRGMVWVFLIENSKERIYV